MRVAHATLACFKAAARVVPCFKLRCSRHYGLTVALSLTPSMYGCGCCFSKWPGLRSPRYAYTAILAHATLSGPSESHPMRANRTHTQAILQVLYPPKFGNHC